MPEHYRTFAHKVRSDYPRFNVKQRDKSWLRPIFWLLREITKQDYRSFTTTIFSTMYVGPDWEKKSDVAQYKTLRHEAVHIKQFHCFPLGRRAWPINHALMAICYLLILPVFWTMRAKFEREGYIQTMLVEYELHGPFSESKMEEWGRWMAGTFGGGAYAWMWTGNKGYEWAMDTMRKINAGEIT